MNTAEQHATVINAARGRIEFNRAIYRARINGNSEVLGVGGQLEEVHFNDKSILVIDHDAQVAADYA